MKEQMHILIVDDELDMLELIGSFCKNKAFILSLQIMEWMPYVSLKRNPLTLLYWIS